MIQRTYEVSIMVEDMPKIGQFVHIVKTASFYDFKVVRNLVRNLKNLI